MGEFDPITIKPSLTLAFEAPDEDLTLALPIFAGNEPKTKNLTVRKDESGNVKEVCLHANYRITVKRGGQDVSAKHKILRYMKQWEAWLNMSKERDGAYQKASRGKGHVIDTIGAKPGLWIDVPRIYFPKKPLSRERLLFEFIVSVEPEPGQLSPQAEWIYFIVVLDFLQTEYRVRVSNSIPLLPAVAYDRVHNAHSAPYRNEAATGPTSITWARDSNWVTYPSGTMDQLPDP